MIDRPRGAVAAYAADPTNAPTWYTNIKDVEWQTAPPMRLGSRVAFVARFLGRRLAYTYEIAEYEPGDRLVFAVGSEAEHVALPLVNRGGVAGVDAVEAVSLS